MLLKELQIGDIFYAASDELMTIKYVVRNNCILKQKHAMLTRFCVRLPKGEIVSKSANLEVIKTGVSKHKEKLQKLFGAPATLSLK